MPKIIENAKVHIEKLVKEQLEKVERMKKLEKKINKTKNKINKLYIGDKSHA